MTDTTALESQIAALNAQLAQANEEKATTSHFTDEDGNVLTHPVALTDAMLRSTGVAMESRAKSMEGWAQRSVEDIETDLKSALTEGDHVAVALYAAMANGVKALAKAI